MSRVVVSVLRCSDCGEALDGLQRDVIFSCPSCHAGWEISAGERTKHVVRVAMPVEEGAGDELHLPFWKLKVDVPGRELDMVWVAAFHMTRPAFFGDPGVVLTEAEALPLEAQKDGEPLRLKGVTRGGAQAERYCRLWFDSLAQGDPARNGEIAVVSKELWAMPFAYQREEGKVLCLTSGKEYSAVLVEDLRSMIG